MKKLSFILLICACTLFGCKKISYTIVCESSNEEWGTVTGGGEYREGATAVLTANPIEGYYFLGWQDGDVSNPRAVIVTENATYIALFGDTPFGAFNGEPMHPSGKICTDQIWPDLGLDVDYIIDGTLYIGCNATVKVMPGVTIMFTGIDGNIEVVENGALNMTGTRNAPILLCGPRTEQYPGSWGRVVVNTSRLDNKFSWVEFRNGGNSEDLHSGVVNVRGSLSMDYCLIDGSNSSGLVTEEGSELPVFSNNEIQNCVGYPWVTSNFAVLCKGIVRDNALSGQNWQNKVYIDQDYYEINDSLTLSGLLQAWYYFPHGFYFDGNGSLTLDEANIYIGAGKQLRVGKNLCFKAIGATTEPYFAALSTNTPWGGMIFESERSGNIIHRYKFYVCGDGPDNSNNAFCLKIAENAKLKLYTCRFGSSRKYGVWIENIETWGNVTHSSNTTFYCPTFVHIEHGGTYNGHTYADNTDLDQLP